MDHNDERVFRALRRPMRNDGIAILTNLHRSDVSKSLKRLRAQGRIVSFGSTSDREHMQLATAIERLYGMFGEIVGEIDALPIKRPHE